MSGLFHQAALEAAARGWAVFPLKARDKVPIIGPSAPGAEDGGFHVASRDSAQIDRWWKSTPGANIGLRTGAASGFFVLDLDGPEAEEALAGLVALHGALPATLQQRTGKGRHILFRHCAGVVNRGGGYLKDGARIKVKGFDVRGEGGYIVAPPSVHPSGRVYQWESDPSSTPIADAPEWLLAAIVPPPPKPAAPYKPIDAAYRTGRASTYGERALDSACRRIAGAQPGTQNTTLTSEAASIGELVAGGEIERGYAETALNNAALQMVEGGKPWRADQLARKVAWGLGVGQTRPRAVRRDEAPPAVRRSVVRRDAGGARASSGEGLLIDPPNSNATLIVAPTEIAAIAARAWENSSGGAYGLFAPVDLLALVGGLAPNAGGFDDWRMPRADFRRPGETMRWKGRVLVVLPALEGFTVSQGTKWERFISAERHAQVCAILAIHWWKHAGASDVAIAELPNDEERQDDAA